MSVETAEPIEVAEREKVPAWLPPVLGFIAGLVLMYGLMKPINDTPDYQRGHQDGYDAARRDLVASQSALYQEGFQAGMRSVANGDLQWQLGYNKAIADFDK